jgi:hypothetical protein
VEDLNRRTAKCVAPAGSPTATAAHSLVTVPTELLRIHSFSKQFQLFASSNITCEFGFRAVLKCLFNDTVH